MSDARRFILGTMNFGQRTPEPEARRIVDAALERGITRFDTANMYGDGESERLLGRILGARRSAVQLITKVGAWRREGLSRARVVASAHESVERLQSGHVDLFVLHRPDPATPLDETLEGLAELLQRGTIRAWGLSNYSAGQQLEVDQACARVGVAPPTHAQLLYNLLLRELDVEYFAFAQRAPRETAVFNPLAGGLLARAIDAPLPSNARIKRSSLYRERYGSPAMRDTARAYETLAQELGLSLPQLAYAWLLQRPGVDRIVLGPAEVAHLHVALEAPALPPGAAVRINELGAPR